MKDPHCTETWNNFSIMPWQSWLDPEGQKKNFCPQSEGGTDNGRLMSTQEWGRKWSFSPFLLFLWLQNCSPLGSLGMAPSHPSASKLHKCPILISHFIYYFASNWNIIRKSLEIKIWNRKIWVRTQAPSFTIYHIKKNYFTVLSFIFLLNFGFSEEEMKSL